MLEEEAMKFQKGFVEEYENQLQEEKTQQVEYNKVEESQDEEEM